MNGNGPCYDWAARAAAQIVNLHDPSAGKAEEFGRILFVILEAMRAAHAELTFHAELAWLEPSDN
ncbi:hypothetical protein [Singulisphaera acidiphila]|uniref:Uncharacterized protein n=1 Tax=Singulisphaera acidiphila (strain ATCC BAA-1392 / DSM 18658 / VKM B-2454 / MOB10) TaxID=886293 RepID=L0DRQ2_SINAD|nr:hypothetical protein [Singulisphaera acidiphila]AGA31693.1 hypothetical protein Sinac_7664 [Singulisphaera acidiphila DSM 18658]